MVNRFNGEYSFLSNFHVCNIQYKGKVYRTSEHLYQAMKFTDNKTIELVRNHPSKGLKEFVHSMEMRKDWEFVKDYYMLSITRLKYRQNKGLKDKLDNTEGIIIEGNYWHDNYWGDCNCKECSHFFGENKLGSILQLVRDECYNNDK